MEELEKFLSNRVLGVRGGKFYWWSDYDSREIPFTAEETFKFLTLSTQAYRESLVSTGSLRKKP